MTSVDRIQFIGTFPSRDQAAGSLRMTGDAALVFRGVARMLLINCPCGCKDILVVNLDKRAGPAWRMYNRNGGLSLFPSYWRDTKCESHFVLWQNHVYWCEWDDESIWTNSNAIEESVLGVLQSEFINYEVLAEKLQEIPWEVLQACYSLTRKGLAESNPRKRSGEFRRVQ